MKMQLLGVFLYLGLRIIIIEWKSAESELFIF